MSVDNIEKSDVNYPEGCLPPTEKIRENATGDGLILEWKLNKAVTTAGMGIALPQVEQPGAKISLVLRNSPYALMLLIVSLSLSLLILGHKISFLDLSLLSSVYCILFYTMSSISDFYIGFWGSLIIGALLTLALSYKLFHKVESLLLKYIIFCLVGFFTLIYPLSGLFPDYVDSFNGIVVICLIIFLLFVSLYSRLKKDV
jgi:hypothetical protein